MRVCQITNVDFSLRHFVWPLMRAARARGHEVVGVCAEGPLLDAVRADGFEVVAMPFARSLNPVAQARAYSALRDFLRARRFDLVHGHMPISGLLARAAARGARTAAGVPRIAYTGHGFLFNQPGPAWRRHLSLALERAAGRITDIFLTVSEEEAADARRLGIHPAATGIGNGRDGGVFRPDAVARARLRAELGANGPVVMGTARLVRHKGWPELLEAMRALPDVTLWVVGERLASDHGDTMAAEFSAAEAALGPRLRLLGYRQDVAALLAAADIFCLPSHFEGLPMSIIEAMLSGLPVVATDIRGPREQVVEGGTGFLVPPGDVAALAGALRALVADPLLRARMGEAGRQRALARFDEAVIHNRTLDLLGL